MKRRSSEMALSVQFGLLILAIYLIASAAAAVAIREDHRATALLHARNEARILADRSLAIHAYFAQELKPSVFDVTDDVLDPEYFEPSWMSSTYAVRQIGSYFDELSDQSYYYRECAVNARSPENEADAIERAFLDECADDPDLVVWDGIRELNGVPNYVLMRRGESMEESCLLCHSDPSVAPAGLVAIYGPTRSFGREAGDLVSVISVRIPLAEAYANADASALRLSMMMLGIMVLGFGLVLAMGHQRIIQPIQSLKQKTERFGGESPPDAAAADEERNEIVALEMAFETMAVRINSQIEALGNTNIELAEANRAKSDFLANISHELRTPLNSIIGFVGVVLLGHAGELTDEQRTQLSMAKRSADHLLTLVNDLLDIASIESGTTKLDLAEVSIADLVSDVVKPMRVRAESKGLELAVRMEGIDHCTIETDRRRAGQILRNLADNAIKFTHEGTVGVEAECSESGVRIKVTDTGPGIPADEIPRLFERFSQVPRNNEAKPSGTGVGLYLVHSYAEKLGGTVSVKSTLGVGTEFVLTLPSRLPEQL